MTESTNPDACRREVTAVILAGGRSVRLGGVDKCGLTLGGRSLIERRIASLQPLVAEVVVVGARGYRDSPGCRGVVDEPTGAGPLGGLRAGLAASRTPWVFATGCDMPFLEPGLFLHLAGERDGAEAVVPAVKGWYEPLFSFYHVRCLSAVTDAIARGEARIASFFTAVRTRYVPSEELEPHDPALASFFNVNTPEDLERARAMLEERLREPS